MPIPETQFDTWSHQGSIAQSSSTYNSIKSTLESPYSLYASQDYKVFLQGSYGNDTNIYKESDVDIIILLNSCFQHDLSDLPDDEKQAFKNSYSNATYTYKDFKRDVLTHLDEKYCDSIDVGEKAVRIQANASRRNADVIVAIEYHRYHKFLSLSNERHDTGICFYDSQNNKIANYPKQHSENCTIKHQETALRFKPMVRIFKNIRECLVNDKIIEKGTAPSYYLEGLLYNVPDDRFGKTYGDTFASSINWILDADRSKFVCANEQYLLLHKNSLVTWREEDCDEFLSAVVDLWNQW